MTFRQPVRHSVLRQETLLKTEVDSAYEMPVTIKIIDYGQVQNFVEALRYKPEGRGFDSR